MNTDERARVLVVDDEPNIRELLSTALRMSGFTVFLAAGGGQALMRAERDRPDIVLLDVMLPDLNGFTVARKLRHRDGNLPVLFLTARDAHADRIAGLTAGGDDYVTKPFDLEEVVLRLRAVLRRSRPRPAPTVLRCADLEADTETRAVRRGDRAIHLSPTEFNLLRYLLANAGRVVGKAQILDQVWGDDFGGDARIVESYISYLRRKVDATAPPLIQTLRGVGYCLRPPIDPEEPETP
ncbi:DNA-binding response regulator [Sphaerisporangium siamense]|uniref:Two-component system OmpR family response regulator n=1 Tax=Sphaerisporangium siamense TaxID=795645 RepID=A0A7W7G6G0_9ACTN|nr:response regulator transcription factor [Sphaerisporangium siamense]MBB4699503.1 two-component system OmpR family response regulator [Sphaerisporangium siamense]GII86916.1 DNA-binding response regulator [Sphaerisporangium siamense]